jgi:hypothetical protein
MVSTFGSSSHPSDNTQPMTVETQPNIASIRHAYASSLQAAKPTRTSMPKPIPRSANERLLLASA